MLPVSLLLAIALVIILSPHHADALWPLPRSFKQGNSPVRLSPDFVIHLQLRNPPADMVSAVIRTQSRLATDAFQRLVPGRGSADAHLLHRAHVVSSLSLVIHEGAPVRSIVDETNQKIDSKRESYSLSVSRHQPNAIIRANSTLGLLRGLTTFEQLWHDYEGTKYLLNGDIDIVDEPAFVR